MRALAKLILRLAGWKISGNIPQDVKKSVIIMAPHTSMMDFVIGRIGLWALNVKPSLIIKKEMFFFPLGILLKVLGGIPIDRHNSRNVVKYVTGLFEKKETFHILITPEGTRELTHNWKRGFYFIAQKTQVPIALGYLDYKKKTGGIGTILYPSGDFEKDFELIENFYRGKNAKYPNKFNL